MTTPDLRHAITAVTDPIHWARYGDADDEAAAAAVREFAAYWPSLEDVPCGNDIIGGPVAGMPDNEELSKLVADGHVEEEE